MRNLRAGNDLVSPGKFLIQPSPPGDTKVPIQHPHAAVKLKAKAASRDPRLRRA